MVAASPVTHVHQHSPLPRFLQHRRRSAISIHEPADQFTLVAMGNQIAPVEDRDGLGDSGRWIADVEHERYAGGSCGGVRVPYRLIRIVLADANAAPKHLDPHDQVAVGLYRLGGEPLGSTKRP